MHKLLHLTYGTVTVNKTGSDLRRNLRKQISGKLEQITPDRKNANQIKAKSDMLDSEMDMHFLPKKKRI